ncbi:MAG: tetratricopeptide repeat protein [Bacteroidota bacterium]
MKKTQLILSITGLLLVVLIFQLPRSVVENDKLQEVTQQEEHSFEMPEEVQSQLLALKAAFNTEIDLVKKTNFAHSVAQQYLDYGLLDSAVSYAEKIEELEIGAERQLSDIYFTAFQRSASADEGTEYASEARKLLTKLLEKDPEDYFLKNRLAMTYVASENPMKGILMLREIVAEDATNRQAILNLGLLSIQSSQYDKALERFKTLVQLDSNDHEAKLYLAVAMLELSQEDQARLLLESITSSEDSIPVIKSMALDYLESI